MINIEFTNHALHVVRERMIHTEWIEQTLTEPSMRVPDPNDPEVERFFRPIPEYGDRVLRVVVNTSVVPWRLVSVFFDRTMKAKL